MTSHNAFSFILSSIQNVIHLPLAFRKGGMECVGVCPICQQQTSGIRSAGAILYLCEDVYAAFSEPDPKPNRTPVPHKTVQGYEVLLNNCSAVC